VASTVSWLDGEVIHGDGMMKNLAKCLFGVMCLHTGALAWATPPETKAHPAAQRDTSTGASVAVPAADRWKRRCQGVHSPTRHVWPQGSLLWGTQWQSPKDERSSVLVSVDAGSLRLEGKDVHGVAVDAGHLVASGGAAAPGGVAGTAEALVGAVFQGQASDGKPVEVALCGAEPAAEDPEMVWYRVEYWNERTQEWENPCAATAEVPQPRALAVHGVWDEQGGRRKRAGQFTFACEVGAIAKCIRWGYKPWEKKNGVQLADHHQACTRMARADYCGNGRSHTTMGNLIDMYDQAGVQQRATTPVAGWDPAQASFEAAWTTEGAYCLEHTRDGRARETILAECPDRFMIGATENLGGGDRCMIRRRGAPVTSLLLRNWSHGKSE
jgi:hypothetical protein